MIFNLTNLFKQVPDVVTAKKDAILVVVLGGTGNLMYSKIAPSLYNIDNVEILGCGKENYSNKEYYSCLKNAICYKLMIPRFKFKRNIEERIKYLSGDFESREFYSNLQKSLHYFRYRNKNKNIKIIIYLAVLPKIFSTIISNLNLKEQVDIIVEKPFGHDEISASKLNNLLLDKFEEKQLFRVEHYLAKEIVKRIYDFRFDYKNKNINNYFDRKYIDEIKITLIERINVDDRGEFYDTVGAIKDVGQNHMLQLLALTLCNQEPNITRSKIDFLKHFTDDIDIDGMKINLFQYDDYTGISGVNPNSKTETAFKFETNFLKGPYEGVKILMLAGKSFNYVNKGIEITFKDCELERLIIDIANSKISLKSTEGEIETVYSDKHNSGVQYVPEYSKLFKAVINSEKEIFVDFEEIRHMWRFTDKVFDKIDKEKILPILYKKGSDWRDL